MAWQTDRNVVDYLQRRIKYYKARLRWAKRIHTDEQAIRYAGGIESLKRQQLELIQLFENRISEYIEAVEILQAFDIK